VAARMPRHTLYLVDERKMESSAAMIVKEHAPVVVWQSNIMRKQQIRFPTRWHDQLSVQKRVHLAQCVVAVESACMVAAMLQ